MRGRGARYLCAGGGVGRAADLAFVSAVEKAVVNARGGGGDGGAIREGEEVDNVFGALTLWGADGALAVLSG